MEDKNINEVISQYEEALKDFSNILNPMFEQINNGNIEVSDETKKMIEEVKHLLK